VKYGERWDIRFNPLKSHAVTVGGNNPSQRQITLNEKSVGLLWANKVKYLGVYIESNTGLTELSDACRKFYGQFNSIMSVLGKCENEMAAIHLIKSYCSPTLMYGCEVWSISDHSLHTISVACNNCFRRVFKCCWRESVKPLQNYCNALPISYFIDQRRLTFWYKMQNSNSIVLRTLSSLKHYSFVAIAAKYGTSLHNVSFKNAVWQTFCSVVLVKC